MSPTDPRNDVPVSPPKYSDSARVRAAGLIPGGSSTGSKRPDALYGAHSHDARLPTHFVRAEGCTLIADNGNLYVDCTMALGAVAIGYADDAITRAVQDAAAAGNVTGVPHLLEVEVAERLVEVIPCAEKVRFLRTGAEATAAAIRIARTATGRTHVLMCGYFGWLDWCSDAAGVPDAVKASASTIVYGDIASLDAAVAEYGSSIAAIIVEPFIHDFAPREWLAALRDRCDRIGAVLVFDEIKTAFRIRTGGVQELLGLLPDLTTVGKALANGYPLAAVVGRAAVMEAATRTWISSTAAAESTGLAAARAVLEWHERGDVPNRLIRSGRALQQAIKGALQEAQYAGIRVEGPPHMFRLVADQEAQLDAFVAAAATHGVLFKRGAYQFAAVAHDESAVQVVHNATRAACRDLENVTT